MKFETFSIPFLDQREMPGRFSVVFPSVTCSFAQAIFLVRISAIGIPFGSYALSVSFIYFIDESTEVETEETFQAVIMDENEVDVPLTVPHDLGSSSHDVGAVRFRLHDLCNPPGLVCERIHLIRLCGDHFTANPNPHRFHN